MLYSMNSLPKMKGKPGGTVLAIIRRSVLPAALFCMSAAFPAVSATPLESPGIQDRALLFSLFEKFPACRHNADTIVLNFIGDVMLHQAQIDNARRDGSFDFSGCLDDIRDRLRAADLSVANMEFTLAGEPYSGYPAFSAPDEYAEYLAQCGTDIFLTANNHILDKGERGLLRTLSVYRTLERDYGIKMTGSAEDAEAKDACYPLFVTVRGLKLAFVNFTYGTNLGIGKEFPGTNLTDREDILRAMDRAGAAGADFIVALPHWGEEYRTAHSRQQEELAVWLAENGADLIVGTHPHVVQDTSVIRTATSAVPVIYSLGNIISNMSAADTQTGLMLEMKLVRNAWGEITEILPEFTFTWCSLPGRLSDRHKTIIIRDWTGRRNEWIQKYEYEKMVSSYRRIKSLTGIED